MTMYYAIDWSSGESMVVGEFLSVEDFVGRLTDRMVTKIMEVGLKPFTGEFFPMPLVESDRDLFTWQGAVWGKLQILNLAAEELKSDPDNEGLKAKLSALSDDFYREYRELRIAVKTARTVTDEVIREIDRQDRWPISE